MYIVILRFQSRDTAMSLCSLKWWGGWKSSESVGKFLSHFHVKFCTAAVSNVFYCLKTAWHSVLEYDLKDILLLSISLYHLNSFHFFLPLLQAHDSFLTPLFLSHLTSKLSANSVGLEWRNIQNLTMSDHLHGYHLGPSHNHLSPALS